MAPGTKHGLEKARDTQLQDIVHNPSDHDTLAEGHMLAAYHNHNHSRDRDSTSLRSVGASPSSFLGVRIGPPHRGQR
jgi:hypothetical protein